MEAHAAEAGTTGLVYAPCRDDRLEGARKREGGTGEKSEALEDEGSEALEDEGSERGRDEVKFERKAAGARSGAPSPIRAELSQKPKATALSPRRILLNNKIFYKRVA